ncbi:MBL fold metallo-hydrolase [Agromyces larvae]|uniref:MBL fold metallo-hydrolase n=1 Tax=Agromyces larvae TaxID=2929802 RepID=A0ABY4BUQ8_9MICO|nr:MBL fold metallo-hydrolase [Agromyces larvae]UOE42933.1 MBL fold metallo-hydrolase [Agromyces larvae]
MARRPTLTRIGGPTLLIELAGWRILVDPTFDPPGRTYSFGWGTSSRKTEGPAMPPTELPPVDVVLLSHDQHADNLDEAGRALLPGAGEVITTAAGARRLRRQGLRRAHGLHAWETAVIPPNDGESSDDGGARDSLTVTATPARHGPAWARPIVGSVIGFALSVGDAPETAVWISGDSVLHDGLRDAASRLDVDVAVVHLGGVQFPVTGSARYTMTASSAIDLIGSLQPRAVVPVHFDQWTHFREPGESARRVLDEASVTVRDRVVWLERGLPTVV